jgi:hypothetical protein
MGEIRKIKALILLLTMVGMMAHNAFPHFHHQHENSTDAVGPTTSSEHHHEHGQSHSHSEEGHSQEEASDDLFDLLLEGHAHSSHSHRVLPLTVHGFKTQKLEVNSSFFLAESSADVLKIETTRPYLRWFEDTTYYKTELSPHPSRGPPILI